MMGLLGYVIAICGVVINGLNSRRALAMTAANALIFIGGITIGDNMRPNIVIERSADSDWTYSKDQTIERDTTITRIVIVNDGRDTVYPTTEYKVIKR